MLAKAASLPMVEGDMYGLNRLLKDATNGQPLIYVMLTDKAGAEIASSEVRSSDLLPHVRKHRTDEVSLPGSPVYRKVHPSGSGYFDIVYPITAHRGDGQETELVGYVRAGMAGDHWQQVMSSRLDLVIGVGTVATGAAILLGFLLIRRITGPLDDLTGVMVAFSRGKLGVRSSVSRRDEIGALAKAFNSMADQHEQTHERIVRLNAELEERVAVRTKQLRELAARDPLTGSYNRRHFSEVVETSLSQAKRYDNDLSCIMLDVDGFKSVNDTHGHQIGDRLLVLVAVTIAGTLRTSDIVARYGGDEFIALLPQTGSEAAGALARRIKERFQQELATTLPDVHVTLSLGIASLQGSHAADAETLVRAADDAMYQAKLGGKNRVVLSTAVAKTASA